MYFLMVENLNVLFESSLRFALDGIIANHSLVITMMVLLWIDKDT